jgi:hypothetical protein
MKTITQKNAFKLLLFLLILFSAKAFSTTLPNDASSSGSGSKFGHVNKAVTNPKKSSNTYAASKSNGMQSKNNKRFKK